VLVLVAEIEQGRGIVELIGDGAVLAHSGMARRKVEIDAFVAGETKCFVTTQVLDTGFDCTDCQCAYQCGRW
jgi:superfamily II DNA or RNA helicase